MEKGIGYGAYEIKCRELMVTKVLFSVTVRTIENATLFQRTSNHKTGFFVNTLKLCIIKSRDVYLMYGDHLSPYVAN